MKIMKWAIAVIVSLVLTANLFSQPDRAKLEEMTREEIMQLSQDVLLDMSIEDLSFLAQKLGVSMDELLKMKISVASKTALTPRETPGIISIITEEEIRNSGARDMIDVLRLVPGFDFGYDVQGVVGVGLRGNWVHEGKMLLMIDGQQMNENSYYNFAFGNHIPVDQIKRIEIIRGPGSAIYGGIAELGVINIITKSGKDISGAEISATYGQLIKSTGRTNLNINTGMTLKNWDISAKGFVGLANRSDQLYAETFDDISDPVDLSKGGSEIKTKHFNLGASGQNLSFRLIYDDYKTRYVSYVDSATGNISTFNEFRSVLGEVNYSLKVNDKLSITPKINYKYNRPYYEEDYWRNFYISRYTGTVSLNYLINEHATVTTGMELYSDHGRCIEDTGIFIVNNQRTINISNMSAFAEGLIKTKKINLVAGGRIEKNSEFGWALAPRIGATGIFKKFHFKTLVSGAFRSPAIGNIDVSKNISPEKSFVTEIELGYRINENMFVTANLYDIKIDNTIIYFDNGGPVAGEDWGYINAKSSGSNGLEVEYRAKYSKGYATINYSYYTVAFRSVPESFAVPNNENHALGLASHKFGINGSLMVSRSFSVSPSFSVFGKKYAYQSLDQDGNPEAGEFSPDYLVNLSLAWDKFLTKGLSLTISGYDLLNQKPSFLQPYNGWYTPYPGRSREILFKLSINLAAFRN